jgi:hypothetical protein
MISRRSCQSNPQVQARCESRDLFYGLSILLNPELSAHMCFVAEWRSRHSRLLTNDLPCNSGPAGAGRRETI